MYRGGTARKEVSCCNANELGVGELVGLITAIEVSVERSLALAGAGGPITSSCALYIGNKHAADLMHTQDTMVVGKSAPTVMKNTRIIEEGYSPRDPRHLTRREVVDDQLNATAINMIHMAVTPKDRAHIRSLKTAKEAWDKLDKLFLGNESIQRSRFDEVNNMADNFVMIEGESPEEMYRRLIALAVQMQDLGATFVDDHWIKRKFYNAILPYEEVKLTSIRQNASFRAMTSDEVLSEVIALDISKKNAEDLVARAHNTR
ncbi:hypothetical protein QYE76_011191 [Lolium multiflorum]|uniref:Uncharacterized protein n=1 Tax=Lolium multiflorum TaxID=4521 RepID=A0AAD8TYM9_LOLMU|nr:hypothetical protein QYE76_011191 [Lolium multiflorum]